jgi:hypothetical protein
MLDRKAVSTAFGGLADSERRTELERNGAEKPKASPVAPATPSTDGSSQSPPDGRTT